MSTNGVASPAEQLHERLNDPKVADGLNRLLDRLDIVSFAAESMDGFLSRGEVIADSVASTVGDLKGAGNENAMELIKKAPKMLETGTKLADAAGAMNVDELAKSRVLERLTDPQTLNTLNELLDRLPLAAFMLESLEGFISRGDTIAESLADSVGDLRGLDTEKTQRLTEVIQTVGRLAKVGLQSLEEVTAKEIEPLGGGVMGMMSVTKDKDVQKMIGFVVSMAKAFTKNHQAAV